VAISQETDTEADEQALKTAKLPIDGPSLLAVFRKRTPDEDSRARIKSLIEQLGDDAYTEREEASEELASCGVEATGLLREALHHSDLEVRRRAREALTSIEQNELSADVLVAALRVLRLRKPPRLTEVLLDYVPFAASTEVAEEVCSTLAATAVRDDDSDPRLLRALTAASPIQRGIAGAAFCRGRDRRHLSAVRRLLRDPDMYVRRRVALALVEMRENAAVPVLIKLLEELPLADAEQVETLLLQIAGEAAPLVNMDESRRKYRDAWAEWWQSRGEAIDLAKIELAPHWRGYSLAILMSGVRGRGVRTGTILEVDGQGRTRWQMQGLFTPVDAQVINEKRVLVTEYSPGQVTERNLTGDVVRRIPVSDMPLEARRLPNGNTFITTRNQVVELDRNDKEVWSSSGAIAGMIVAACRFRGGEVGICHRTGDFVRVDRKGQVLASFRAGRLFRPFGTHIQALPNGNVLVPLFYDNKVVEFDPKGREVWSVQFARPTSAQRLPNGRTLVAGFGSNSIVELDRSGREVKSTPCLGRLQCVNGR
jgi:HEAT repeat protein